MLQYLLKRILMRGDSVEEPTSKLRFVGNRFSRLFEKAIDTLEPPGIQTLRPVVLTYWDTYYGPRPPLDGVLNDTRILELIDKTKINPLANKRKLPELLAKAEVCTLVEFLVQILRQILVQGSNRLE